MTEQHEKQWRQLEDAIKKAHDAFDLLMAPLKAQRDQVERLRNAPAYRWALYNKLTAIRSLLEAAYTDHAEEISKCKIKVIADDGATELEFTLLSSLGGIQDGITDAISTFEMFEEIENTTDTFTFSHDKVPK